MAGIYIHIPYCSRFCRYCDFYSVKENRDYDEFIEALGKELTERCDSFKRLGVTVDTVYFGGGTPSLLSPASLGSVLNKVAELYPTSGNRFKEVTIEVNPDDITDEYATALVEVGFNRVSIGIQSFHDSHLKWMNRRHTATVAVDAFEKLREAGFKNLSLDLIFGFNQLTAHEWKYNLESAIKLSPEHISAYQLGIEKGTKLYREFNEGIYIPPAEKNSETQYKALQRNLAEAGYIQYEVSSFCKPGFVSIHNSSYWDNIPYFGFGPSAHSYDGTCRSWNISSLGRYIKSVNKGASYSSGEKLTQRDSFNETVMVSLRRVKGLDMKQLEKQHPRLITPRFIKKKEELIKKRELKEVNGFLQIPVNRLFISDAIIRELFV